MSWIGVDLDGTLAEYNGWISWDYIGPPVGAMLRRVKTWLQSGEDVRIMTARVSSRALMANGCTLEQVTHIIQEWCYRYIGIRLKVTCEKDMYMGQLWDDRAVQVEPNTGRRVDGLP